MKYDFDEQIERRGSDCLKYDFAAEKGMPEDILPLWVADMDFKTAPCITERIKKDADFGIFGYTDSRDDYFRTLAKWYETYFDWKVEKDWLVKTPGVVFALATAVAAFTEEGDGVLIQQPVYYPFSAVIRDNNRKLINNGLLFKDGRYEMDFADFERKIVQEKVKLFILCSPHNPVGRVWTEEELRRVGEICLKYDVKIVSDEIHSDFIYPGHRHHVLTTVDDRLRDISVICTAPSKTFNLAGLQVSNIWIPNSGLRDAFRGRMRQIGCNEVNMLGLHACQAAYEGGREWLEQLKEYLKGNLDFVRNYLEEYLPQLKLVEPEGTYLVWLDCRALGMPEKEREQFIVQKAKLWLDGGAMFGEAGEGFERINIACPRATLEEALERLKKAVASLTV
ncbi:MAG: pyridoxal phosphate-dependent aminotransferase [Blautia sp.]|nr:pyridoxal phosphate-dependent aminotransferase [Blautia sp.]MCM1201955.1 pyridoxal phosphate-dependent aminotransferase [Bacteroides fragilis]